MQLTAATPTSTTACLCRLARRSNEALAVKLIGRIHSQPEAVPQPARLRMDGHEVSCEVETHLNRPRVIVMSVLGGMNELEPPRRWN